MECGSVVAVAGNNAGLRWSDDTLRNARISFIDMLLNEADKIFLGCGLGSVKHGKFPAKCLCGIGVNSFLRTFGKGMVNVHVA